eukprot:Nitzschia sp. Nitz4//scaffold349_size16934//11381//13073//NITZ4_008849-RA/size16934-snap-gene-0.4-mRNA-1//-1//CDS//3329548710//7751//frame0
MQFRSFCLYVCSLCWLMSSEVVSLDPLLIQGYKFFDSGTGDEVVIKGIDYYPRPNRGDLNANSVDYYTDEHSHIWKRDIPFFQELGVNAIRLYAVNASQNHDAFMCALESAGIYVVVALAHDCPTCAITRDSAYPSGDCYPPELKAQGQAVINAFAKYPNTLAFSAGNEVNHYAPPNQPQWNAPCQKKFIRDMRAYVNSCSETMRPVPIGLVAADSDRDANAMYYNCQEDPDDPFEYAEWFGLNSYVHCSNVTHYKDALGFQALRDSFQSYNLSIPVMLTEFGCLSEYFPTVDSYEGQRTFYQAKWILREPDLHDLFAGGFAFEYSMEYANAANESPYPFTKFGKQDYGIGFFSPEECDDVDVNCKYHALPSFNALQQAYSDDAMTINGTTMDDFIVDREGRSKCPEGFPTLASIEWKADNFAFGKCPAAKASKDFTCKAINAGSIISKERSNHSFKGTIMMGLLVGICIMLSVRTYLRHMGKREISYQDLQDVLSADSASDDSTGLVSLKGFHGGVKTRYQAIESDSGSELSDSNV